MRVLELGSYVAPAYAGMILAEQGHRVTKWTSGKADPIQELAQGDELWAWINEGKVLTECPARMIVGLAPGTFDVVIDNIRAATWERWGVDPEHEADRLTVPWVSLRDDFDGRGFDALAQARAWGDHVGYIPTYIGDTSFGLWAAFKALSEYAEGRYGHCVLRQGACLAKLVEGELVVTPYSARGRSETTPPWDEPGTYGDVGDGVAVDFKGETIREPYRDDGWRWRHLRHRGGRYLI